MNVIVPLFVATKESLSPIDTYLSSSNIPEPDTNAIPAEKYWDASAFYPVGDQVTRPNTHMIYENILAGVDATQPEIDARLAQPTRWIRKGGNNRFAMFDTLRNTSSSNSSIDFTITPSQRVDSFFVDRLVGSYFILTMTVGGTEVYRYEQDLATRVVLNWYDYFFKPFVVIPKIAKFNMPPHFGCEIRVQITSTSGVAGLGSFVLGSYVYVGEVVYGASLNDQNFSRIDRNFDGSLELLQRRSVSKITGQIYSSNFDTNKLRELKKNINAIPAVFSGLDDKESNPYFDGLLMLAVYKRFEINIASASNTIIDFEIEEV